MDVTKRWWALACASAELGVPVRHPADLLTGDVSQRCDAATLLSVVDPADPAWDRYAAEPPPVLTTVLAQPNLPRRIIERVLADRGDRRAAALRSFPANPALTAAGLDRLAPFDVDAAVKLVSNPAWFAAHPADPGAVGAALTASLVERTGRLLEALNVPHAQADPQGWDWLLGAVLANPALPPGWVDQALHRPLPEVLAAAAPSIAGRPDVGRGLFQRLFEVLPGRFGADAARDTMSANPAIGGYLAAMMATNSDDKRWGRIWENPALPEDLHASKLAALLRWPDRPGLKARLARNPLTSRAAALELVGSDRADRSVTREALANPNLTIVDLCTAARSPIGEIAATAQMQLRRRGHWVGFLDAFAPLSSSSAFVTPHGAPTVSASQLVPLVEFAAAGLSPLEAVTAAGLI